MEHTREEIVEGNKLLAEFMDWTKSPIHGWLPKDKEDNVVTFKTYVSLTVEKSGNKMYKDFSFAHADYITAEQTSKEAAFKLLVRFIKWHNEHVKQLETI